jgi:Mu-like prophage protein gp29
MTYQGKNNKRYNSKSKGRKTALKKADTKTPQRRDGYIQKIVPKTISMTRNDIGTWKRALQAARNTERPRRARLYNLYQDIMLDAHLTALIELRMQYTLSTPYNILHNGKVDQEYTELLQSKMWTTQLNRHVLDIRQWEHSLIELDKIDNDLTVGLIPRNNVVPEQGLLLLQEDNDKGIRYREAREYGSYILEFWEPNQFGLLNKAIPHALFKRFAQSCWSELCEIYAIPPRFIKTDTNDPAMLDRAEAMLRDMGAAAWFIIDTTEEFSFAKGADTNGDVYNNLITLCKNELSQLEMGAIIGQDTKHGNESKEKTSQQLFEKIILSDKGLLEGAWNSTILPALARIGILPPDRTFQFQQEEDLEKLWKMTYEAMPHMQIDPKWIRTKFGIEVTGIRESTVNNLKIDTSGFFD